MENIKMLGERILIDKIKVEEDENKTESGILLLEGSNAKKDSIYREAKVLVAGTEVKNINSGDKILFDKRAVVDIVINGKEYNMFNQSSVIAVL